MEEKGWGRTVTPNWLRNPRTQKQPHVFHDVLVLTSTRTELLQALLEAEKNNPDEFCPVPQHYMELTQLFLRSCQK